ncbi:hypothetical protein [Pseudomonas chlororaphis]|uniref:hypothetical protein n=1 Tax=Pseudomonas chlororaphis TaxID=587753 RepID=UPI001B311017|nr:hypothetical protein [Pseudomonas chlororaphis]QTT88296.1 hypothetical protein HUT28_13225 [Pseudomonas chlororaphis]
MSLPVYEAHKEQRESFDQHGWTILPGLMNELDILEVRRQLEPLMEQRVSNASGSFSLLEELDLKSDFFYELARSRVFSSLSEAFLNMASIAIHIKYLSLSGFSSEEKFGFYRQNQHVHSQHFDVGALSFTLPLNPGAHEIYRFSKSGREALLPHVGGEHSLEPPYIPAFRPPGGHTVVRAKEGDCLVHHSSVPYGFAGGTPGHDLELLVINYRMSPYREAWKLNSQKGAV